MSRWQDIKTFLTSKQVKKSLWIFLGIAGVMFLIVMLSMMLGCSTNHYTKVQRPELLVYNQVKSGAKVRTYFIVANPTSERQHYLLKCCIPKTLEDCATKKVIVAPRSDKHVSMTLVADSECFLVQDNTPGSE